MVSVYQKVCTLSIALLRSLVDLDGCFEDVVAYLAALSVDLIFLQKYSNKQCDVIQIARPENRAGNRFVPTIAPLAGHLLVALFLRLRALYSEVIAIS